MTDKQLAAIRARCDAATPGPWCIKWSDHLKPWIEVYTKTYYSEETQAAGHPDHQLIAHAREDIACLLAEIAALRELMADRENDLQFEYDRANQAEAEIERLRGLLSRRRPLPHHAQRDVRPSGGDGVGGGMSLINSA